MRAKEASASAVAADADLTGVEERLAPVAFAYPERRPRPDLWRRIEAAIDSADRTEGSAADAPEREMKVVRREEGWRQYTRDVQIKKLWDDRTFLLRCAPGGVLPAHEHPSFEHCVVLEGDMIVGGETFGSGDYQGMPAHIAHQEISSRTGLLMLVRYE